MKGYVKFQPEEIRGLRESLGMGPKQFAYLFDVGVSTILNWETGVHPCEGSAVAILNMMRYTVAGSFTKELKIFRDMYVRMPLLTSPQRIRSIRESTQLTPAEFALPLNVSDNAVRNWEKGKRIPVGPSRVLLEMIEVKEGFIYDLDRIRMKPKFYAKLNKE